MAAFGGSGTGWRSAVLGIIVAMGMAAQALGATDPSIAKAVAVKPEATGQLDGATHALLTEDDLYQGQKISTGPQGEVQIVFADDTHMVVGAGSSLVIETYLMRNGGTASSFAVNALGGTFRFITGKSPKAAYSITTPTGTIGVRGTKFDFSVDKGNGKTTVVLYEGQVNICAKVGGCQRVQRRCDVGIAQGSGAQVIDTRTSQGSAAGNFPYVSSQQRLRNDFRVGGASQCGQKAAVVDRQPKPDKPEPKPEPKSDKPPGKPDPIPDPLPE